MTGGDGSRLIVIPVVKPIMGAGPREGGMSVLLCTNQSLGLQRGSTAVRFSPTLGGMVVLMGRCVRTLRVAC